MREQLFFLLLCLSVLKGDSRYIEVSFSTHFNTFDSIPLLKYCQTFLQNNEISKDELYSFFNSELKRETPEELMYRRPLRESRPLVLLYSHVYE